MFMFMEVSMFEELTIGAYLIIAWRHINGGSGLSPARRKAMLVAVVLNDRSEVDVLLETAIAASADASASALKG